jgi:hypothetical protein
VSEQDNAGALAEVLAALDDTKGELKAAGDELARLRKYGRRNRLWIVIDIALTLLLSGVGALSVHAVQSAGQANSSAGQIHASNLAACQAGNIRLVKQRRALDAILSQVPPQTAAARAIVSKDVGYILAGWEPRDCQAAYPLPSGR